MDSTLILHVGNSRMKWGLRGPRGWLAQGVLPNAEIGTLSLRDWQNLQRPVRAIGVNAAGEAARVRVESQVARWRVPIEWLVAQDAGAGVVNRYRPAAQLGADRWALLVAARQRAVASELFPSPCVAVNAGTVVTVDALDADGRVPRRPHPAGSAPHAAGDRRAHGRAPDPARALPRLPDDHADALASGVVQAVCGAIEQMRVAVAARGRRREVLPDRRRGARDRAAPYRSAGGRG